MYVIDESEWPGMRVTECEDDSFSDDNEIDYRK